MLSTIIVTWKRVRGQVPDSFEIICVILCDCSLSQIFIIRNISIIRNLIRVPDVVSVAVIYHGHQSTHISVVSVVSVVVKKSVTVRVTINNLRMIKTMRQRPVPRPFL